ncbi:MAG TPA: acyl-CoA dehydrogenase family protein [Dongiaceae bacterium]|jgi:alkylation response protein AidB-like acyl-CoA dehydrogenase
MQGSGIAGGRNLYLSDPNLRRLLARVAPALVDRHADRLAAFGAWAGTEVDAAAAYTDRFAPPTLNITDRDGDLLSSVMCNPNYEEVHRQVYAHGIVALNHCPPAEPFLLTFAMGYLLAQADISIHCPATLTGAVAYILDRFAPQHLKDRYLSELIRQDGRAATGATWATERQGGSDLGATTTTARVTGDGVELTGLKWFCSNAPADVALVTARPEGAPPGSKGLGLYLLPRLCPDGGSNRYRVRRLKEKLGTRGLPTGEIELYGAYALEVAPPPEGIKLMMEALEFSRVHNAMAGAGVQRRAFIEALGHAEERHAFGAALSSFPMIRELLLDMQVELEASVVLAFEAAQAFDMAACDTTAGAWLRTVTALAKYRTAEGAVRSASRAIEVLGGNGYTEEFVTARLLRDAQVLTVWEGPPNIQALELLRMVRVEQGGFEAFGQRVEAILAGVPEVLGDAVAAVSAALEDCCQAIAYIRDHSSDASCHGRRLLDLMADILSAALLLEEAAIGVASGDARKALVANRFIAQRLILPARRGLAPLDDPAQRHFDLIAHDKDVPLAVLRSL